MTTQAMTPVDWAKRPIQKYADFSGRAPRSEYWWFYLGTVISYLVALILDSLVGMNVVGPYGLFALILGLALIVPGLAVTIRRLHDTNRSGWWVLIAAVPYFIVGIVTGMAVASGSMAGLGTAGLLSIVAFVGAIVLLVFMILPGTPGDNRYGPNPLAG